VNVNSGSLKMVEVILLSLRQQSWKQPRQPPRLPQM